MGPMLGGLIYGYGSGGILRVTLCAGLMRQGCNGVQRCVRILPKRLERRVGCGRAAKLLQAIDCCLAGSLFPGGHASAGPPASMRHSRVGETAGVLWQGGEVRTGESENTTRELPAFGLASILLLLGRQFNKP